MRLKNIVDDLKKVDGDILYAFVQDERGQVMVHTFPGGFPVELLTANPLPAWTSAHSQSWPRTTSASTTSPPR